jgi:hypothetical protein
VAEVADLFNQLHEADPKRAVELSRQVREKVSEKIGTKLDGMEKLNTNQPPATPQKPIEAPIAGLKDGEEPPRSNIPLTGSSTLAELGEEANKIARGVLGPAYDKAAALLKLAEELSPGADIRDTLDGSCDAADGIKNADAKRIATGSAAMAAGIAGIFVPGSPGSMSRMVRAIEDGGTGGSKNFRRDISDMPYEQWLKHEGDAPVVPDSPEANIDRGYKSMVGVLQTGKADMAAPPGDLFYEKEKTMKLQYINKIILMIVVLLIPINTAKAAMVCGKRSDVIRQLKQRFAETTSARGITGKNLLELYTSKTGSFTVVITRTDGVSCLLAAGENWHTTQERKKKPQS